jgi:predicted dehydrogenase
LDAPTRIAVIGCGFYAQNHLAAWHDLAREGAIVVAVCDRDAGRAERAGAAFGLPWFTDASAMLDAVQPDLVDIVTRMDSHRTLVASATRYGVGVIVQKPLAPHWDDCIAIAETAGQAGIFAAVHENFRYQPAVVRVKALIDTNAIGAVSFARISFRTGFDVYAAQPYLLTEPRGVILDLGIHLLDLSRVFCGEVAHLSAETQRRNPRVIAEDTATIILRHEGGAVSVVDCTYESRRLPDGFPDSLLEIEGEAGAIQLSPGNRLVVTSRGSTTEEVVAVPTPSWGEPRWRSSQVAVLQTNRHLLWRFRMGQPADTDIVDNLRTYALVDAAYTAASLRQAVVPKRWSA